MKRLILSVMVLTAMLSFSGCSDTKEDVIEDYIAWDAECNNDPDNCNLNGDKLFEFLINYKKDS